MEEEAGVAEPVVMDRGLRPISTAVVLRNLHRVVVMAVNLVCLSDVDQNQRSTTWIFIWI